MSDAESNCLVVYTECLVDVHFDSNAIVIVGTKRSLEAIKLTRCQVVHVLINLVGGLRALQVVRVSCVLI